MAGGLGTNRGSGCLLVFDDILKNVIKLLGGWGRGCGVGGGGCSDKELMRMPHRIRGFGKHSSIPRNVGMLGGGGRQVFCQQVEDGPERVIDGGRSNETKKSRIGK